MTRCTNCGHDNAAEFRFCGSCGQALNEGACPACGFANPAGQRFCGRCGTGLAAAAPSTAEAPQRGERRLATVLFADVVGFTSFADGTDPEAVATAVDQALRRMAQIVVEYGGTVDKYIGDSVMALFGIPTSHGDDAERAVAAALAMREQGGELRFSIGINSGEVMATTVGEGGEVTAIGDAVNVAARLEETAAAGEILVGPLTAELVRERFLLRPRNPALLKGKREPVIVFEVLEGRSRGEGDAGTTPPLVDREADLNFLVACWRRAVARSRAQVVVLTGEAGIGKTRIADELAAVAGDALVARSSCPGYGSLVGARLGSELAGALSQEPSSEPLPAISLDEQGVLRLRRLLAERAAEQPVLLVIDDMQNASAADLEPLAQLAARAAELPVLILLVGRSEPPGWLGTFGGATTVRLDPLAPEDSARLAAAIAGDHPLDGGAAQQIALEAGGNPLHIRELIRLLCSNEGLVLRSGRYSLGERLPLPASLSAVLSARLDGLSPVDKEVVQVVAIFSDGASSEEMSAVAGRDVGSALERLVTTGLLHQEEGGRFVVADPLLREVAYEQLPHSARGRRHRTAAGVAATPLGRARHLGLAARYLSSDSRLREEAAASLASTGIAVLETSDFRGGIELLRQAVALGYEDPRTLIRLAQAETDLGNSAQAHALLDSVDTGGDPWLEAAVLHARANDMHPQQGRGLEMLAEVADRWKQLGDQQKQAWALANLGNALFQLGRVDDAVPNIEAALEIFRGIGDDSGGAAAGQQLSLMKPDDPRVPQLLAHGLRLAEEAGDLVKTRNALIPLAWVRFIRTHLGGEDATAEALNDAQHLARVAGDIGDPVFEVQGHGIAAVLYRLLGRLDEAEDRIRQARQVTLPAESMSIPFLAAAAFVVSLARGGDPAKRPPVAASAGPIEVMSDALIVEALLLGGHVEAALEHLVASPLDVGPTGSPVLARLIGVSRGAVLLFTSRYDETEESLLAARDAARAVDALPTEVTAVALLAEARYRQGRADQARELIDDIGEDPGGVAALLRDRVRVLLGDAGMEPHVREQAASLLAPGLALDPAGE